MNKKTKALLALAVVGVAAYYILKPKKKNCCGFNGKFSNPNISGVPVIIK